jgi:hypothetical protein
MEWSPVRLELAAINIAPINIALTEGFCACSRAGFYCCRAVESSKPYAKIFKALSYLGIRI